MLLVLLLVFRTTACSGLQDYEVYSKLSENYMTFRIPGLIVAANKTLLAFAEGRVATDKPIIGNASVCYGTLASILDSRCVDKDIVVKRSYDGGQSWTRVDVITNSNSTYFYSNPNAAVDPDGRIYVSYWRCEVATYYSDCVDVVFQSDDNGETFSSPDYLLTNREGIGGPGGGWVVRYAEGKPWQGRIVFGKHDLSMLYSDDQGTSWKDGTATGHGSESEIAELTNGTLVRCVRSGYEPLILNSTDGGMSWNKIDTSPLMNPDCQMSLTSFIRYDPGRGDIITLLLSHANSDITPSPNGRLNMTVHASSDGITWQPLLVIYPGPSAYSSTIQYNSTTAACLYERSDGKPPIDFDSINIAFFPVKWQ